MKPVNYLTESESIKRAREEVRTANDMPFPVPSASPSEGRPEGGMPTSVGFDKDKKTQR